MGDDLFYVGLEVDVGCEDIVAFEFLVLIKEFVILDQLLIFLLPVNPLKARYQLSVLHVGNEEKN